MEFAPAGAPYDAHYRENVVHVLRLLAAPDAQLDYQRRVPVAQVTAELFCQWANDVFWPDDPRLRSLFSDAEWMALVTFNTCFESISARAREPLPPIGEFVQHPLGRELADAARDALRSFFDGREEA